MYRIITNQPNKFTALLVAMSFPSLNAIIKFTDDLGLTEDEFDSLTILKVA